MVDLLGLGTGGAFSTATGEPAASGAGPQVAFSPLDNVEMVSYYNGGNACVKRKLGDSAWSDEIVVTTAKESVFPLVPILESRLGQWAIYVTKDDDSIIRYLSNDSGRTWAADV